MPVMSLRHRVTAMVASLVLAGCVTNPVGRVADPAAYTDKARHTVADTSSAVGTADLAAGTELTGRSFRSYTTQVVDDALATLITAQDTFETVVPPDEASAALRPRVLDTVAAARRALIDLRAALAGGDDAVARAVEPLGPLADQLDALDQELSG
jgi:hypothetical protein